MHEAPLGLEASGGRRRVDLEEDVAGDVEDVAKGRGKNVECCMYLQQNEEYWQVIYRMFQFVDARLSNNGKKAVVAASGHPCQNPCAPPLRFQAGPESHNPCEREVEPMKNRQQPSQKRRLRMIWGSLVSLLACTPISALAQVPLSFSALNAQQLQPAPGLENSFTQVSGVGTPGHLGSTFGLLTHYDHRPLSLLNEESGETADILEHQLVTDVLLGLGLGKNLQLGLVVPLLLDQAAGQSSLVSLPPLDGRAPGDLRLAARYRLLNQESGLGLGLEALVGLPTGASDRLFGWGRVTFEPKIVAEYRASSRLRLGLNAGAALLRQGEVLASNGIEQKTLLEIKDELTWGVGAEVGLLPERLALIGETFGRVSIGSALSFPTEALLSLRASLWGKQWVSLGVGAGLTVGYGTPMFRVLLGYGFSPDTRGPQDRDHDLVLDSADTCPDVPEDADHFQDEDGCPDPDNDGDSLPDPQDSCPLDAEDADGFADADGCPDPDNDADRVPDAQDRCPDSSEDHDSFQDEDGCIDPDNDHDLLLDAQDRCPDTAEDKDGLADDDGCPETDADQDGVADAQDRCPTRPETLNGNRDEDGCPDAGPVKVILTRNRVEILESIYFDVNRDIILKKSFPLLLQVAQLLRGHPELTLLEVEGHTDNQGDDTLNSNLSERRARAVLQFLVKAGIEPSRLQYKGYGETRPIAPNTTAAGRARNRRVVFAILQVDGKPLDGKPLDGKPLDKTTAPATAP